MVGMSGIVMLKMNQNHFASMQNGCYVSYSYVENEPKSLSNHTEWLYPVLWIRIRICMDPELLPGSGSGTRKIQSWIRIRNK